MILAKKRVIEVAAISDAPADVKLRKKVTIPTYYPGVTAIEGAQPVI